MMRRVEPMAPIEWLRDATPKSGHDGYTGFNVDAWEANTWILNAMYECEIQLPDISADELHNRHLASGEVEPEVVNGLNLDDLTTNSGIPQGRTRAPHVGWRRLLWSELAAREGSPLASSGVPPCFKWFSYRSWPIRIRSFAQGSLDRESYLRLSEILLGSTQNGRIWCYFSPLLTDLETLVVVEATVSELPSIYDYAEVKGSPSNIWPEDRSWLVYSDADLSGTRVSGSAELVRRIVADDELETTSYP
jgi:hypothetical protein